MDILTPKDIDIKIKKPNNDSKFPTPELGGKDPTIIGDPTESMIK
ncbi:MULTISPECIES: hypothetical protein [Anaerovibrio]|nr:MULTISPECIES: hypothetical protein [Anaerovibrio]